MNTKALIKIIGISLVLASLFFVGGSRAAGITVNNAYSYSPSYSSCNFVVDMDSTSGDSLIDKVVLFWGTSISNMVRKDSLRAAVSLTYPDTMKEAAGKFQNGTTYYWYIAATDTTGTYYYPPFYKENPFTFTTTNYTQHQTITTGYSTAQIINDSVGYYIAAIDSIILQYGKVSGTYTVAETITTVTHPDTFALTGLDEGATYYGRCLIYDVSLLGAIADTGTEQSFTTTDLQSLVSVLRHNIDSLILKIDSVDFCPDSFIIQYGNSALQLTQDSAVAETVTTVTCPDTIIITGIIEGEVTYYQVLFFLPDSSAVDTGSVGSYTRTHNSFMEKIDNTLGFWPSTCEHRYKWEFTGAGSYSTGPIPITTRFIRVHAAIDGADDLSPGDSIAAYIFSWDHGDSTVIDTILAQDADTATGTPISYMMQPGVITDSSIAHYPLFNWGTHYSISAVEVDTTIYEDSTIGLRTVGVVIEEIK